jgi:hypothetical protein
LERVVDQDVEPARPVGDGCHQSRQGRGIEQVGPDCHRRTGANVVETGDEILRVRGGIPVMDCDARAGGMQRRRDRAPDSSRGAGDERRGSLERC